MPASLPIDTLTLFFSVSVLLALSPGPDNFYVLSQSALHNTKTGIVITLGLCSGLIFHTALVVLGIAALIQTTPIAFSFLQIAGALYLIYLAIISFKAATQHVTESQGSSNLIASYQRGIIMNISNPKVSLFFIALLPQFTQPDKNNIEWQLVQLGLVFMLATLIVFSTIAAMAGQVSRWINTNPQIQTLLHYLASAIFILISGYILISVLPTLTTSFTNDL